MTPKKRGKTRTHGKPAPKRSAYEWRQPFLAALANSANVRASCQAAGISREAAYNLRQADATFRKAWDNAIEEGIDLLEAEVMLRARKSSDLLAIFMLKAHRPQKYRESVEHTGAGGGPLTIMWNAPMPKWAKRYPK